MPIAIDGVSSRDVRLLAVEAIRERDELRAANERMKKLLVELEWSASVRIDYDDDARGCPSCGGLDPTDSHVESGHTDGNQVGHEDGCELAAILGLTMGV